MFRPPVSYFMLAAFFTISTLRLTGLAARGLRYRYGEKIPLQVLAAGSCSCWLAPTAALPGLNWTALSSASNVLRLPFALCLRLLAKNYECDYVVQHKDCTYLNEIYSRHKMFVIPPEKTLSR